MFILWPSYLVPWAIIVSAFEAASVINVGGAFPVGITPYFFVVSLIAIRFVPRWLSGRTGFVETDSALPIVRSLILLTLWGVLSAFALPHLFAGIEVDTPRQRMDPLYTEPLRWTMSNAAQAGYLVLNAMFLVHALSSESSERRLRLNVGAFCISGLIVAAVGSYQLVAHLTGLPFPSSFLNSNTAWEQLMDQSIAGTWRVSATFNEPSSAGMFFSMWTAFLLFLGAPGTHRRPWALMLLACGLIMLVLTTSTTGYLAVALLLLLFAKKELTQIIARGTISLRGLGTLVVAAVAIISAATLLPHFHQVLQDILWNKRESISGRDRTATSFQALYIAVKTWGLGAGLGSNRPSGMIFYIVSNIGIAGLMLFGLMIYQTRIWLMKIKMNFAARSYAFGIAVAAGWALAFELVAMSISGADISSPQIWISWALVLTACKCGEAEVERIPIGIATVEREVLRRSQPLEA